MTTRPTHYRPGPYEAIKVIEAWDLNFNLGNVVKYVSRAGLKSANPIEDLQKARQYLDFEIARLGGKSEPASGEPKAEPAEPTLARPTYQPVRTTDADALRALFTLGAKVRGPDCVGIVEFGTVVRASHSEIGIDFFDEPDDPVLYDLRDLSTREDLAFYEILTDASKA